MQGGSLLPAPTWAPCLYFLFACVRTRAVHESCELLSASRELLGLVQLCCCGPARAARGRGAASRRRRLAAHTFIQCMADLPPPPLPFGRISLSPPRVPPLTDLALESLAENCDALIDIRGLAEQHVAALLWKVVQRGKLDFRLACIFRDAGHAPIREVILSLDLLSGMPTHNVESRHRPLGW